MRKLLGLAAGSLLAAVAAPSLAQAQNAYTTDYVNLRAGPGLEYPVVFEVAQGQPIESYGCLDGYSWCDVSVDGYRGWMAGEFIQYAYGGSYVPLYVYGPRYHVPIISFSFVSYWDTHYRHYNWYRYRDNWSHYDWRRNRWDDDRWRVWAHNNRHDWDRHDGRRDGRHDGDWRNGRNDRHDGDRDRHRDGDRDGRNGGWNHGDNDRHDGQWNGRNSFRSDNNDRRPGAPVRGNDGRNRNFGSGSSDPSVHSGTTGNHDNGTRFGNPQRWGGNSYKPDSVTYGNQNRRFDNNDGNKGQRFDRNVVTPKVDTPRATTPKFERPDNRVNTYVNRNVDRNVGSPKVDAPKNYKADRGNNDRVNVDRSNKRNDGGNNRNEGRNNKRDRDRDRDRDGRS